MGLCPILILQGFKIPLFNHLKPSEKEYENAPANENENANENV